MIARSSGVNLPPGRTPRRVGAPSDPRAGAPPVALSIVAPCFNEQEVLAAFVARAAAVCAAITDDYEIVLVDDGSTDRTWQVIRQSEPREKIVAVKLARNHGHQLALTAGLEICRGERVLIIDADLQDPPELLPRMMALMDEGADVVFGQREQREGESWAKRATAGLFYRLISNLSETPIPLDTGDFRLISRRALDVLNAMPERHRFVRGMVAWIGFRQVPIRYTRQARHAGTTKYPLRKMLRLALDALTAFSTKPLAIASLLAVATSVFGMGILGYAFLGWMYGRTVSGWTSMLGAIAIFNSAQLLMLGILGEYLGRLYQEAKGRPLFVVEEVRIGAQTPADS
jgi:polyisoprenyl-phosphate glycosyltransferase